MQPASDALRDAMTSTFGGRWNVIAAGDMYVLRAGDRIAKVARFPAGRARLANGCAGAVQAAAMGVNAAVPVHCDVVDTAAGAATLWPYVEHTGSYTPGDAHRHGAQLAVLANIALPATNWDPFNDLIELSADRFPGNGAADSVAAAVRAAQTSMPASYTTVFAHGAPSPANALCSPDGSVHLIDFDGSGAQPAGWDYASMYTHIGSSATLWDAFRAGWLTTAPNPLAWERWVPVHVALQASRLLTMPATPERVAHTRRLAHWVQAATVAAPDSLPPIAAVGFPGRW